jgi:GNAT superfamily N-acetyltransferase
MRHCIEQVFEKARSSRSWGGGRAATNRCRQEAHPAHDVGVPLTISVLADRPDLAEAMWAMPSSWPEFMRHDPLGGLYYGNVELRFAEFVLVAQDEAGEVVACGHSIPFVLGDEALPDNGWDFVIRDGVLASLRGKEPDAISAVEIAVRPDRQGAGISGQLLAALRDNAGRCGFPELLAPVHCDVEHGVAVYVEPNVWVVHRTRG